MQQTVSFITLGVTDLARSVAFYRDALGWAPTMEVDGEISFFQVASGVLLGIWKVEELEADSGGEPMSGTTMALAQNYDSDAEVDAAFERAVAAGARPLKTPQVHAAIGLYHGYVADPDGNRWELAHNPGWSVGTDGTVWLS